jgi:hypothetical protein
MAAMSACTAPWQLAVLENVADLMAVPQGMFSNTYWVGAHQGSGVWTWLNGSAVAMSAWDFGYPSPTGAVCASLDTRRARLRNQVPCDSGLGYVCTAP